MIYHHCISWWVVLSSFCTLTVACTSKLTNSYCLPWPILYGLVKPWMSHFMWQSVFVYLGLYCMAWLTVSVLFREWNLIRNPIVYHIPHNLHFSTIVPDLYCTFIKIHRVSCKWIHLLHSANYGSDVVVPFWIDAIHA